MADGIDHVIHVPGQGAQVFISHSQGDISLLEWIVKQVEATGNIAWVAEWRVEPGGRISQKVEAALRASDAYVLLLTEGGFASSYVQHEVGAAVMSGKPVIALVDRALADRPMGMLADIEQVRFDPTDLAASTAAIVAGLSRVQAAQGLPPASIEVPSDQTLVKLRLDMTAELHITSEDLVFGVCAAALILGLLYLSRGNS